MATLEAEKQQLLVEIGSLRRQILEGDALLKEAQRRLSDAEPILREAEKFSGFNKIMDKDSRVVAIGRFLFSLLSIIIKHTANKCLLAVCDAIFGLAIFCAPVTKTVLG